jgi:hypothetical protein
MITGGNWWRANEIVIRHLTRQTDARYRCRDRAVKRADVIGATDQRNIRASGLYSPQNKAEDMTATTT